MPIIIKLNLGNDMTAPGGRDTAGVCQLSTVFLKSLMATAKGSLVSGMRQQTRIIQRAAANAFFDNCADLKSDLSCSTTILSNIFSNIVSARHEIVQLPYLDKELRPHANLIIRTGKNMFINNSNLQEVPLDPK